jgi:beta-glucosidase
MNGNSTARISFGRAAVIGCALFALLSASCSSRDSATPSSNPSEQAAPGKAHPALWPQAQSPIPADAALERRIAQQLDSMSLEDKVGQIIQADVASVTPEDVHRYRLGSILNGGNSGPGGDDFAPARAWLAAADAYYLASVDKSDGGPGIPVLWGLDAVHGHANIIGATIFPHNIALGATRDVDLIRQIGAVTAREMRVTGQEWNFGPTLAVVRDDRWGRTYESYSEDPEIVRMFATAMVTGLQGEPGSADFLRPPHVISTAKHFLGDGGTAEGRDQGDNPSSEAQLRDIHGAGYPAAIAAGVQSVMVSYSSWQGVKMHGNSSLLTEVLKGRMGFDGIVVSDWNAHGQIPGCTTFSCPPALIAGLDMFMAPDSWKKLYENTLAQAKSGEVPSARLDDAVRRILRVKLRSGLFEAGKPSSRPFAGQFELLGAPEHRAVARRAVRESLVLLKNANRLLPLSPRQRVLVAGDGADDIGKQSGGWTLSWQGTGTKRTQFPNAQSIYDGIRDAVRAAGGVAQLSRQGTYTARPDVAIVVFGENPYAEFQGDLLDVEYSAGDKSDLALLRKLGSAGIPVVAIFLAGRPLWTNPEINASNAFVAAWLPGSEGGGVADVLFRKPDGSVNHDFSGKLSFSWPQTPDQTSVNRGDRGDSPLFSFGYGLTYADAGELAPLQEDVPRSAAASIDSRTFFAKGKIGRGWRLFVQEGNGPRIEPSGARRGTDSGSVEVLAEDRASQEDSRVAKWNGTAPAIFGIEGQAPIDLQRETNGELSLAFDYRVTDAPTAEVLLSIECGVGCKGSVPVTGVLKGAPHDEWRQLKILLSCFQTAGADMKKVSAPLVLGTAGKLALSITNVRLETGKADVLACPR